LTRELNARKNVEFKEKMLAETRVFPAERTSPERDTSCIHFLALSGVVRKTMSSPFTFTGQGAL